MTYIVRSLIGSTQTLDTVDLGAYKTQYRNALTAALIAAAAAKTIQYVYEAGVDYVAPLTGASYTVPEDADTALIVPAGTIAALTVVMPAQPADKKRVTLSFDQVVTALTMSVAGGSGHTIKGGLTAATAKGFATWMYNAADKSWYRVA